jgi:acetyl esterase/lipase
VPEFATVEYACPDGRALKLDVFAPSSGRDERTAVLLLHGGGWRRGDKAMVHPRAEALSSHGFACLAVEYRLAGEAPWPAQLDDVMAAIRWVRASADQLGIDPGRVVLEGFSAGGHLALMTALRAGRDESQSVAAVVAFFAPAHLYGRTEGPITEADPALADIICHRRDDGAFPASMLLGADADGADAALVSPLHQVDGTFPPTMLVHGTDDQVLAPAGTRALYSALAGAGVITDLHMYSGQGHEFDRSSAFNDMLQREVAFFLRRTVSDVERFAAESASLTV